MDPQLYNMDYDIGQRANVAWDYEDVVKDMEGIMARSEAVDLARWKKRSWFKKVLEKVLRVFSIWM